MLEFVDVVERAKRGALEYSQGNDASSLGASLNAEKVRWHSSNEGLYKLNTDAAMFAGHEIGMAGVLRAFEGDVVMNICCVVKGIVVVDIAKALSARHGSN